MQQSDLAEAAFAHRAPISVAMYHEMIDAGVLSEKARVELIEGELVAVSPASRAHVYAVQALLRSLYDGLGREWVILPGGPMTLARSEPEPDIVIVRREVFDQAPRHPTTASLVIEVAKSSLYLDRALAATYAEAGVPDYWIVDVEHRQVEVYRDAPGHMTVKPPTSLSPLELPAIVISVGSLFRQD